MAVAGGQISLALAKVPCLLPLASSFNLDSSKLLGPKRNQEQKWVGGNTMYAKTRLGSFKGGAGLLDRPAFDQSQFEPMTQVEEGGNVGQLSYKKGVGSGDSYRVLLIDDIRHTENLVAKVLPQVVPSVTPDDGRRLFLESREKAVTLVIVTVKRLSSLCNTMLVQNRRVPANFDSHRATSAKGIGSMSDSCCRSNGHGCLECQKYSSTTGYSRATQQG